MTKTSHMWKNLLIFFFCILIIDIFYSWRCSTKGVALRKEPHSTPLQSPYMKLFWKAKRDLELVSLLHFLHDFWRKLFILINQSCATCVCNYLLTKLCCHKFWNQHYVSNQAVFSTWPKSQDNNLNTLRTKKVFKMK